MPEIRESSVPAAPDSARDAAAASREHPAAPREDPAAAFLAAAYPDERERTRALGGLTWIAWHMGTGRELAWWDIPDWVGERKLRSARIWTGSITLGLFFAATAALADPAYGPWGGGIAAVLGWLIGRSKRMRPGRLRRERLPQAMVPCWPRSWRDRVSLAAGVSTGLFVRRKLIRMWARPVADSPSATGDSSYRACRRSTAIDGLACVTSGLPAALLALALGPGMLVIGGVLAGLGYLAALTDGKVPPVKLAELVLLVQWRRRVRFHRLLERGVERQVLRPAGAYYQFRDAPLQDYLAAVHQAGADARARRIPDAVAAARPGVRTRLISLLSSDTILRLAVFAGGGVGVTAAVLLAQGQIAGGISWGSWFGVVIGWVAFVVGIPVLVAGSLHGLVRLTRWSLWVTSRLSPRVRVAVPAGVVAVAGLTVWLAGPGAVRHGIAVAAVGLLPAALVAGVGSWAAALAHRRWRTARRRWVRLAGDLTLAAAAVMTTLLLADRNLLAVQAAAGLLLPVALWLSVVAWRTMNNSERPLVRAGTDIATSLMVGATLVMFLVWLANVLRMPAAEVAVLRDALHRARELIDLPWWLWAGLYALLAGASLAFARWPAKLAKATRWVTRLRVAPTANLTRRVLGGAHIGLLVIALIGLTTPTAVGPVLRARLAARYTETLSADLRAHGELTAYREMRREFGLEFTPAELAVLIAMVVQIDDISRPAAGPSGATGTELDLARRLGELQGEALGLVPSPVLDRTETAAARQAGFGAPVRNAEDLSHRIGKLDHEQGDEDETAKLVDEAAEQAATALAAALHIPRIGELEIVQVIAEYLGGLVENSPLKDVLADWAGRFTGAHAPPPAQETVVPDPARLKAAAAQEVTRELAAVRVTNPAAVRRLLSESAIVAAVDLTNQLRYLQEDSGPCDGCARPEPSGQEPGQGPDEQEPDIVGG